MTGFLPVMTCRPMEQATVPDLDVGRPGAQAWWEAPCADIESSGRGWRMKSLLFPRIINIYDVIL